MTKAKQMRNGCRTQCKLKKLKVSEIV